THCHLDAPEFASDREQVIERARAAGVRSIVVPSVGVFDFQAARETAKAAPGGVYALGIHPLFTPTAGEADLEALEQDIQLRLDDPDFVAVVEIGLDHFVPGLKADEPGRHQEGLSEAQWAMAQRNGLPVLLHGRRS